MKTITKPSITERIINGLRKAAVELEEFRLQATLGKADARDNYEHVKKEFNQYIHSAGLKFNKTKTTAKTSGMKLKALFEELQLQLALGKADTRDAFNEQKKGILEILDRMERAILSKEAVNAFYSDLLHEIGKFRIKLEIMRTGFEMRKADAKKDFEKKKRDFSDRISRLKQKWSGKEHEKNQRWEHFQDEMGEAYTHLKKTFVKA